MTDNDDALGRYLAREDLSPELLLEALKLAEARNREPVEVRLERIKQEREVSTPWYRYVPFAALFTVLGGALTAAITGGFDLSTKREERTQSLQLKELEYQYAAFDNLVQIDPEDFSAENAQKEREARVCLAATFGLIEVPGFVLGVEQTQTKDYAEKLKSLLQERYSCNEATVPTQFPAPRPITGETNEGCPNDLAANRLEIPDGLAESEVSGDKVLYAALRELNLGVHEVCQSERVGLYWKSVGLNLDGTDRDVPWSAAFLSYLIDTAGNPNQLTLDPSSARIWHSAVEKNIAFLPGEKDPVPGDLVFQVSRGVAQDVRGRTNFPSHGGVVYSVIENEILYIGGNVNNTVSHLTLQLDDPKLIGFVRLQ